MRYLLLLLCIVMAASASAQVQYLGSPTTTVRNRGNFVSDSLFYLPKRQKLPTDTGAIRYAIADSSVYVWTGYQWNKLSPGSFVAIGDTASMLSPYTRGSGTTNYLPKFTGTRTFGNSLVIDDGSSIIVNSGSSYSYKFATYTNTTGRAALFYRGTQGNDASMPTSHGTPYVSIGGQENLVDGLQTIGFGFTNGSYIQPVEIGFKFNSLSGYTNGHLVFATRSTTGNSAPQERMRLSYDGKLLIGTTTDAGAYALQVAGSIYSTTGAAFAVSSGNVGVGTASPVYKFESSNDIKAGQRLIASGNLTASSWVENSVTIGYSSTNGYGWVIAGGASDRTNLVLYNNVGIKNTSPAYALDVTGDTRSTTSAYFATSSGSVGIGTTSPSYKLDVSGEFRATGNSRIPGWVFATDNIAVATDSTTFLSFRRRVDNAQEYFIGSVLYNGVSALRINASGGSQGFQYIGSGFVAYAGGSTESMRLVGSELYLGYSGTHSDAGAYALQVTGAIYNTTTLTTGAPNSGSAKPWRLGEAATVSPTSPNRTIRVEIDGTVYYIHAKTTND